MRRKKNNGPKTSSSQSEQLFRISLPFETTLEIKATNEQEAWKIYCQTRGILQTDHQPVIEKIASPTRHTRGKE